VFCYFFLPTLAVHANHVEQWENQMKFGTFDKPFNPKLKL